MEEFIKIENISLNLNKKVFFHNLSIVFYKGKNVFICGTSASGKSLLLNIIADKIKYSGKVSLNAKIAVILDQDYFKSSLVEDELKYVLLNENQKGFVNNFFSKDMLKMNPNNLNFYQKKILLLCTFLYQNPQIIFIDNLYSFMKKEDIEIFRDYFLKNNITQVVVSNNIEESLNYEYMIVMNDGIIAIEGQTKQVLQEEKLLKRLGIGLPFYVDLSIQLQYYNLIDDIYFTKEELQKKLWN